jgi:hypothetical protein
LRIAICYEVLQESAFGLVEFQRNGVQQMLVVRPVPGTPPGKESIDAGWVPRRLRAHRVKTADTGGCAGRLNQQACSRRLRGSFLMVMRDYVY